MRIARGALLASWFVAAMASAPSTSVAADGLGLTPSAATPPWARWQGRISLSNTAPMWRAGLAGYDTAGLRPASVSVLGDYYFTDPLFVGGGGFRATSGVIVGLRPLGGPVGADLLTDTATSPYVGVGYTGLSSRGAWRYSADLGLLAQTPGNSAVRFGRPLGGNTDDLLRDVRLGPSLQLGVSYLF